MPPTTRTDKFQPLGQNQTRCLLLGIDSHGTEHVYDRERNRIVALDCDGIHAQYDLDAINKSKADWMYFVDDTRGWAVEQWDGYKLAEALFGAP